MAKDGKKLELYEILAAKRAKGKGPIGVDAKPVRQANAPDGERPEQERVTSAPGLIVDDAVSAEMMAGRDASAVHETLGLPSFREQPRFRDRAERISAAVEPLPAPEPKPRSPKEVVFSLDIAFVLFFLPVLGMLISAYFIGYKRGQEERPAGLVGMGDVDASSPERVIVRQLAPAPLSTLQPPEQDYTLILRTEPASDELPERLELELSEAVSRGRQAGGGDIQGFVFRTTGSDPRYVLSVGLGRTANDNELNKLLQIYNRMEGVTLSRESRPYIGCRIAPIRELGTLVSY